MIPAWVDPREYPFAPKALEEPPKGRRPLGIRDPEAKFHARRVEIHTTTLGGLRPMTHETLITSDPLFEVGTAPGIEFGAPAPGLDPNVRDEENAKSALVGHRHRATHGFGRLGEGRLEDARPPRFANMVGLVFLAAASAAYLAGLQTLGATLGLLVAALALLAATTGFCAGCTAYKIGYRLTGRRFVSCPLPPPL